MGKDLKTKKEERLGKEFITNEGYVAKIIEYNNCLDVFVTFVGYEIVRKHCTYKSIKEGFVSNPYHPSLYGVGYIGVGKHKSSEKTNGKKKKTRNYTIWSCMMERCYGKKYQSRSRAYIGCSVCEEWHNFQVFSEWVEKNYYKIGNNKMQLDKDILVKGNKIYSPDTCIFVDNRINSLFIKSKIRKYDLPIGVCYRPKEDKYTAHLKGTTIGGLFDFPEEAFEVYKREKEKHIKEIADQYKDKIPEKLYNAMYAYEVEITD